jgi:hypothetical protein
MTHILPRNSQLEKIEPYITNGGVEGRKEYDQLRIYELASKFDQTGALKAADMNTAEKVGQVMVVVRRHYILDKHGKFVSINPKRYALLRANGDSHPRDESEG